VGKTRLVQGLNSWPGGGQKKCSCLRCGFVFKSRDKENRICWRCVQRNALIALGAALPLHLTRFGSDE
jgi:hypothetical protein